MLQSIYQQLSSSFFGKCVLIFLFCIIAFPFLKSLYYFYYLIATSQVGFPMRSLRVFWGQNDEYSVTGRLVISIFWYICMLGIVINFPLLWLTKYIETPERYQYYRVLSWLSALILSLITTEFYFKGILTLLAVFIATLLLTLLPGAYVYFKTNNQQKLCGADLFSPWEYKAFYILGFFASFILFFYYGVLAFKYCMWAITPVAEFVGLA